MWSNALTRRMVLFGVIVMSMAGCGSAPAVSDPPPVTAGPQVTAPATMTGPSASASRVLIRDSICYGACVSGYEFAHQPSLIVYDDGSVLRTRFGEATTAGWVDMSWLRQRMATYLAGGVGDVDPVGLKFADGGATTVDYVDGAGVNIHIKADLLEMAEWDQQLTQPNVRSRANLRTLLDEIDEAIVVGPLWSPDTLRVTVTDMETSGEASDWPDIDPSLTAQLLPGTTVTVTGPDAIKLFAAASSAMPYTSWRINGQVIDLIIVPELP